jgi:hypothetical protein
MWLEEKARALPWDGGLCDTYTTNTGTIAYVFHLPQSSQGIFFRYVCQLGALVSSDRKPRSNCLQKNQAVLMGNA